MRSEVSVLLTAGAVFLLQTPLPAGSLAAEASQITSQEGENRGVPSLSISGGALIEEQKGSVNSVLFQGGMSPPVPLQGETKGDDLVVSPFVGAGLELMSPALPIPTRPRLFLGAEILPTFGSEREVATQADPDCVKGPEFDAVCVSDLTGPLERSFNEESAQGEGSNTITLTDTLTFGASVGVAFPARIGRRQLRLKPSFGWIHYKIDGSGLVVDAECAPSVNPQDQPGDTQCTDEQDSAAGSPFFPGFLRETRLQGDKSQMFNAIGGGLDIEMDTIRYGPVGASLFVGGSFYRTLGDRTIGFSDSETFNDQLGMNDRADAEWEIEVDPWMYRAHVGIRFQWLGFPE